MFKPGFTFKAALAFSALALALAPSVYATNFALDEAHSSVAFKVKSNKAYYVQGMFSKISGKFAIDSIPDKCSFDFVVAADSVDTGLEKRDQHLKSADFFNVNQFPTIKFVSKKVKATSTGYEVQGELTLLSQTKPVNVVFTKVGQSKVEGYGGVVVGYEATFEIDRTDFGMNYGSDGGKIDRIVKLTVNISGKSLD